LEVLVETVARSRNGLESFMEKTRGVVDCYDLPESPLGMPAPSSLAVAVYLRTTYGVCVVPHVRLLDVNALALLSQIKALELIGIDRVLLTMGDKPLVGKPVNDLDTESAVALVKSKGFKGRIAVIASLKYSLDKIAERVRGGADVFYVLKAGPGSLGKIESLYRLVRDAGKQMYVYVLVGSPRNMHMLEAIGQPYVKPGELEDFIRALRNVSDGVVLSSPMDEDNLVRSVALAHSLS